MCGKNEENSLTPAGPPRLTRFAGTTETMTVNFKNKAVSDGRRCVCTSVTR